MCIRDSLNIICKISMLALFCVITNPTCLPSSTDEFMDTCSCSFNFMARWWNFYGNIFSPLDLKFSSTFSNYNIITSFIFPFIPLTPFMYCLSQLYSIFNLCVCIYIYTHIFTYMYIYKCTCISICTYIQICRYISTHIFNAFI